MSLPGTQSRRRAMARTSQTYLGHKSIQHTVLQAPACFRIEGRAYTQMAEGLLWAYFERKR